MLTNQQCRVKLSLSAEWLRVALMIIYGQNMEDTVGFYRLAYAEIQIEALLLYNKK